ncbi:MAG TPA: aminotransferase class I/II-fold pyridoxal phosphate-dependent enzyme [Clostridiales bacterium]|nr:aminotransferase class I/II-fold pyridoxal phosphate-dependent enzyme [Clostridiales bacterium]
MQTPIYDFLLKYSNRKMLRMHMPGHKGRAGDNILSRVYSLDITEIDGADSLFEADGIIAESEQNASKLFKTKATFYSAQGSTHCIQAMLTLMKQENRRIIAVRNSHKAFLNACILLDLDVEWIYPNYENSILSGEVNIDDIKSALQKSPNPSCVYITSPDYMGKTADIATISAVCKEHNATLIVDNAHGAHLAFTSPVLHPTALGADLCCDSAHKMLPTLTGSAYLHIGNEKYLNKAKSAMSLFASTSPSYLILASLDLCNLYLEESVAEDIKRCEKSILLLKSALSCEYIFYESEPFHLTIMGKNGVILAKKLEEQGIQPEYYDSECVVLLFSPTNTDEDFTRLEKALKGINLPDVSVSGGIFLPNLQNAMSMRDAVFSEYEEIEVEESLGRVCASVKIPCPPAVPIIVSGEIVSEECIKILKRYGISRINVIK